MVPVVLGGGTTPEVTGTLNSVGTISFGVLSPSSMSIPTKVMMDMKMEKSLMSFLNWRHPQAHRNTLLFWEFCSKSSYFLCL